MTPEEIRHALSHLGDRRKQLRGEARDVREQMEPLIRAGVDVGMSKSELARLSGMNRTTIYDLLEPGDV